MRPAILAVLLAVLTGQVTPACGEVVVELQSGQRIRCDELCSTLGGQTLDLAIVRPALSLSRRLRWTEVARVNSGRGWASADEYRRLHGGETGARVAGFTMPTVATEDPFAPPARALRNQHDVLPRPGAMRSAEPRSDAPTDSAVVHVEMVNTQDANWPAAVTAFGPTWAEPGARGTVVGDRDDPLAAYSDLSAVLYPAGIPTVERGVALDLFRLARARQLAEGAWPVPLMEGGSAPPWDSGSSPRMPTHPWATVSAPADETSGSAIIVGFSTPTASHAESSRLPNNAILTATLFAQRQRVIPGFGPTLVADRGDVFRAETWTLRGDEADRWGQFFLPLSDSATALTGAIAPLATLELTIAIPGVRTERRVVAVDLKGPLDPVRTNAAIVFQRDRLGPNAEAARRLNSPRLWSPSAVRPERRVFTVEP